MGFEKRQETMFHHFHKAHEKLKNLSRWFPLNNKIKDKNDNSEIIQSDYSDVDVFAQALQFGTTIKSCHVYLISTLNNEKMSVSLSITSTPSVSTLYLNGQNKRN